MTKSVIGKINVDTLEINKNALNFIVMGDWGRNGADYQIPVAQQMNLIAEKYNVDFIISTGDNFYTDGVKTVNDPQWKTSYEDIYSGKALQKNWYVVLGNHDYRGNPDVEIAYTQTSNRWYMPAHYFGVNKKIGDTASALFVFIDSSPFVKDYWNNHKQFPKIYLQDTLKQLHWIDSVLKVSKAKWKFAIGHHPIYSAGLAHGDTHELIAVLKPILTKYKVQAYFAGHDHDLQYLKPVGDSIDYFVSGAACNTRQPKNRDISKFSSSKAGFVLVSLTPSAMQVFFISYQGALLNKTKRTL